MIYGALGYETTPFEGLGFRIEQHRCMRACTRGGQERIGMWRFGCRRTGELDKAMGGGHGMSPGDGR